MLVSIRSSMPRCCMRIRLLWCTTHLQMFNAEEMIKCIAELVKVDHEWVPYSTTSSLYIRPTLIGTEVSTLYFTSKMNDSWWSLKSHPTIIQFQLFFGLKTILLKNRKKRTFIFRRHSALDIRIRRWCLLLSVRSANTMKRDSNRYRYLPILNLFAHSPAVSVHSRWAGKCVFCLYNKHFFF